MRIIWSIVKQKALNTKHKAKTFIPHFQPSHLQHFLDYHRYSLDRRVSSCCLFCKVTYLETNIFTPSSLTSIMLAIQVEARNRNVRVAMCNAIAHYILARKTIMQLGHASSLSHIWGTPTFHRTRICFAGTGSCSLGVFWCFIKTRKNIHKSGSFDNK